MWIDGGANVMQRRIYISAYQHTQTTTFTVVIGVIVIVIAITEWHKTKTKFRHHISNETLNVLCVYAKIISKFAEIDNTRFWLFFYLPIRW